ncbi:LINE-1 retrotransposable element ORF2 protein [Cucumis melo var. makuwa]|nr:LINE-1 retrotransposable element ORF2 protein [Cucumis melo var. makuwa]
MKGVSLSDNCNTSHHLFADVILIFVENNDKYLNNLQIALSLFERASRLKFNHSKSTISPINMSADRTDQVARKFGFLPKFLLVNYLGVPLGGNLNSKSFWGQTIESIHKKLNGWKYSKSSKEEDLPLSNLHYQASSRINSLPSKLLPLSTKKLKNIGGIFCGEVTRTNKMHI